MVLAFVVNILVVEGVHRNAPNISPDRVRFRGHPIVLDAALKWGLLREIPAICPFFARANEIWLIRFSTFTFGMLNVPGRTVNRLGRQHWGTLAE